MQQNLRAAISVGLFHKLDSSSHQYPLGHWDDQRQQGQGDQLNHNVVEVDRGLSLKVFYQQKWDSLEEERR